MSFDLLVFDPGSVPLDREGFLAWYESQFEEGEEEGHIFDEPSVCPPELRSWFLDMIQLFPALNGPYARRAPSDPKCADYNVARTSIYVCFRWSEAGNAYEAAIELAEKHKVGFFDVSADDGAVWVPDPDGGYVRLHGV